MKSHSLVALTCVAVLVATTAAKALDFSSALDSSANTGVSLLRAVYAEFADTSFTARNYIGEAVGTETNGAPFVLTLRACVPAGAVLKGSNVYSYSYVCSASATKTAMDGSVSPCSATFAWNNSDALARNGRRVTFTGTSTRERVVETTCQAGHMDAIATAGGPTRLALQDPGAPILKLDPLRQFFPDF
jgi:hypothetical protein